MGGQTQEMQKEKIKKFIESGADLIGAGVGGAIGFFTGGPTTAALGSAGGVILSKGIKSVLTDFVDRALSEKEQTRVSMSAVYIANQIQEKLKNGLVPRNDDFFSEDEKGYSSGKELFEGILLKCKSEHEEKKISYISNIFSNIAFDESISTEQGTHVLKAAESMTYREMCILSLFMRKDELREIELVNSFEGSEPSFDAALIVQEIFIMQGKNLLYASDEIVTHMWQTSPKKLTIQPIGEYYYSLLGLNNIPLVDLMRIANHLT